MMLRLRSAAAFLRKLAAPLVWLLRKLSPPFVWLWRRLAPPFIWVFRKIAAPFVWLLGRWRALVRFFTEVPEDIALSDTLGEVLDSREALKDIFVGLGEHLDALRRHLFRAVVALLLTTAISFTFASQLMAVLAMPVGQADAERVLGIFRLPLAQAVDELVQIGQQGLDQLQVIEPTEAVGVFMRVSLLAGLAFAMPWIVFELYLFIAPGLMPRSRLLLLFAIPIASLLFIAGLLFTYFVMLPAAIPFLYTFAGFRAAWRPSAYFNLVTGLMFWIGVAFQMPLIIYTLAAAGLVRAGQLAAQWRAAVIVIAVIAAAVTPTVDPINMLLVMLPMMLLYGFSIVGAAVAQAARRSEIRRHAAQMEPSR